MWSVPVLLLVLVLTAAIGRRRERRKAEEARAQVLVKYAIYRAGLDTGAQQRFDAIAQRFANDREWMGVDMEVEEAVKAMISASAAQLLLNLPEARLADFTRVIVHRHHFRSARTLRMHVGETRPQAGEIVISWADLIFGYSLSHDAENVGLHELAHALWFENLYLGERCAAWTTARIDEWKRLSAATIQEIRAGRETLLSAYAGTNEAEFFAVAVEFFFERAVDMQAKHPALYACLCGLLAQDPAATAPAGTVDQRQRTPVPA